MTDLQFAPVAPLEALKVLARLKVLGNYQLLIAPIVLERRHEYRDFFKIHDDQFIIVDNGIIETGQPLPARQLAIAAWDVGAQLVVMPDRIDDMAATVRLTEAGLKEFRSLDKATDTMGVVQGKTFAECMVCATRLAGLGVDWLAIPRGLPVNLKTRIEITRCVGNECGLPMHLLGWTENVMDDMISCASHPLVKGNDAATPVWLATSSHRQLPDRAPNLAGYGRRPSNFWQPETRLWDSTVSQEYLAHNVETVRLWLRAAKAVHTPREELAGQLGQ